MVHAIEAKAAFVDEGFTGDVLHGNGYGQGFSRVSGWLTKNRNVCAQPAVPAYDLATAHSHG
jgi:hypothetical protein